MAGNPLMAMLMARKKAAAGAMPATPTPAAAPDETEGGPTDRADEEAGETQPGTFAHHAAKAQFHHHLLQHKMKRQLPVHAKLALHHAMKAMTFMQKNAGGPSHG